MNNGIFRFRFIPRGFTLIELLIVVAIIAILAAIAVPNFLEAQTRSKVSRAKADLRTLATAMEAYNVDTNKYPPDAQFGAIYASFLPRLCALTTPIAYITSVPEDPFGAGALTHDPAWSDAYKIPYASGPVFHPLCFDYAWRIRPDGSDEDVSPVTGLWTTTGRISRNVTTVMWAMRSIGPDITATYLGVVDPRVKTYDPTNGSVSNGDIFYLGPGIGFDSGPV